MYKVIRTTRTGRQVTVSTRVSLDDATDECVRLNGVRNEYRVGLPTRQLSCA